MFNLWKRTYVQLFSQRNIFDTKAIVADSAWSSVILPDTAFTGGGSLVHQEHSLDALVSKQYNNQIGELFTELLTDSECKWSIVVGYEDYHKLLRLSYEPIHVVLIVTVIEVVVDVRVRQHVEICVGKLIGVL